MEQVKAAASNTATFNSFAIRQQSPTHNGTLASFGKNSSKKLALLSMGVKSGSQQNSLGTIG